MLKAVGVAAILAVLLVISTAEILDRSSQIKVLNTEISAHKASMANLQAALEDRELERKEVANRFALIAKGIQELKDNDEKILEWASTPIPDGVVDFMRENRPNW